MSVKDELRDLIEQLDAEQAEVAAEYLRRLLDGTAGDRVATLVSMSARMQQLSAPARQFFAAPPMSLAKLARQQGVSPVPSVDAIAGHFWPDDERADDFVAAVSEWRRDGGPA